MALTIADVGLLLVPLVVSFLLVVGVMPPFIRYLTRKGRVVDDAHKTPPTKVPSPVGPVLFAGAAAGEVVAYAAYHSLVPLALLGVAAVAFAVGIVDDLYVLGGKTKPLLLLLAGAPMVLAVLVQSSVYDPSLSFPLLKTTADHFIIYTVLVIAAFPIVANAFNMMDSFNGQLSWFSVLTAGAVLFASLVRLAYSPGFEPGRVAATMPLLAVSLGFLVFNRYPSRAFDGDSGALMLGAMFAGLAVVDGVEVVAIVAILPAILNSFYTLSSVRGFVERRRMAARPTFVDDQGRLNASLDKAAPITLVRLVLLGGPLTERELVSSMTKLTATACLLSAAAAVLTWVI